MTRRTVFGTLLGLVFLVNLARVVFAPLLEPLRAALGAGDAALGAVATLAWLGSALPRLPTGYLLTRVSRKKVIAGSGTALALAAAATSFAHSVLTVMVGAFLMGLASGAYFIAANPLVSELFPSRVGTSMGVHGTGAQLAAVSAPTIVVLALAVGDWQTVMRAMAVAAALVTVAFLLTARRTEMPDAGTEDRRLLEAARRQWRLIVTGVAVIGLAGLTWNGLFNFYVTFMEAKGLSNAAANQLLTVVFGAGVPAFVVSGRLVDRLPVVPYLLGVLGAFAVCVLALTQASGFWALAAVSVVTGYVIHSLFPAVDTYMLGTLPDRHRASAYAVYSASMMIVQASGSFVVGNLAGLGVPFDVIFVGLAGVVAVGLAGLVGLHATGRLPASARAESSST